MNSAPSTPAIERTRRRVSELRPYERNPRAITPSRLTNLTRSLEQDREFLEARPLLVNSYPGRENVVIAGTMRLRAAIELGWNDVPVLIVSVPPNIEAQWNLKDNNQWGDYIQDDLAAMLAELGAEGVDLEHLGFGPDDLERLLALASGAIPGDDEAFDPTPPLVPQTQTGDLLLLGPHRVACADSRDPGAWDVLMGADRPGDAVAKAMWTDPPYGVDLGGVALPTRGDPNALAIQGDLPGEVEPLLRSVFCQADRWLQPGAPFYIAGPSGPMGATFIREIERAGWHLAQTLIWVKNSFVPGRADYHYQHEAIYYGWKTGAAHVWLGATDQPTVLDDEPGLAGLTKPELVALVKELRTARGTDVLREDKTRHNDLHPTMKPTGLIRQMLGNSTRRGDLVIDPFAGSGSTLVAAELMGRHVAAIELEPRYCDVIARRWLELDPANSALRVRDGVTEAIGPGATAR